MSEAIGLAREAAEFLRQQNRPDMAAAIEMLRLAALVTTEESLTPGQVAGLIGRHRNTVRNWVKWGLIKAVRTGPRGDLRVPRSEVARVRQVLEGMDDLPTFDKHEMQACFDERREFTAAVRARRQERRQ